MSNYIEYARIFVYGTVSMSKAIYYYSREYNLFINDENRNLYLNVMFDAYWKENLDISNEEIIKTLIKKSKIEPISFFDGIKDPKIKEELKNVTQEAHDKEIFGAPTFVVNNKIFWGQDRLEFALDEYNR